MGAVNSFVRNDEIDGQGKEILYFAQRIKLSKQQLDRLYHEFIKYEEPKTHLVDIHYLFDKCGLPLNLIESLLFMFFDELKTFKLNFLDFVIILFNFLASRDEDLSNMCFMLFDIGQ
jgi:hypothetical protein